MRVWFMLDGFVSWWMARMTELFPRFLTGSAGRARNGIVVVADSSGEIAIWLRRKGLAEPLTEGVAARMASRREVFLRPPAAVVLEKVHVMPTASRRDLDQMLRHELSRISPFPAGALLWDWRSRVSRADKTRSQIALTMVPRVAVADVLERLAAIGIHPGFLEVGPIDRPRLLPIAEVAKRRTEGQVVRGLAWTCLGLAVAVLILPFCLQAIALHATNDAIEELRPTVAQVEELRRGITADGAGHEVLAQEMRRTGDVLQVLATITRILPDDTYLTDFAFRSLHLTIGGRSAAAPRLITGLSSDPAIRNAAFAAPVTRLEGATSDVFSIQGEIVP
jgi:general secretion pathway protein L